MWTAVWHGIHLRGINIFIMLHNSLCCITPSSPFIQQAPMFILLVWVSEIQIRGRGKQRFTWPNVSHPHTHTATHTHLQMYSRHASIWNYSTFWNLFQLFMSFNNNFAPFWKWCCELHVLVYVCAWVCVCVLLSVDNSHLCNNHRRHKSLWMCRCLMK